MILKPKNQNLINLNANLFYQTKTKKFQNYILIDYTIIYELSNFDHVLGVVSENRTSDRNRTHDPQANNLAHDLPHYQSTRKRFNFRKSYYFAEII